MKVRTMITLGIGYAMGAQLSPPQVMNWLRTALDDRSIKVPSSNAADENDVEWPDASFRI